VIAIFADDRVDDDPVKRHVPFVKWLDVGILFRVAKECDVHESLISQYFQGHDSPLGSKLIDIEQNKRTLGSVSRTQDTSLTSSPSSRSDCSGSSSNETQIIRTI